MLKKLVTLVLVATLSINASCGTLTGWTRDEPFKEAVIIGNAGLFLYAIIPGVVGFIVDGYNGKLNRQTTQQPTEQTVEKAVEKSPQQPTRQTVEKAVPTKLNHEDPNKKWFFDVGSNTCDWCIAYFGLLLVVFPDIGVGYYLNNKIATSVNIGHALHGFRSEHNYNSSFYIENRWLYNFINRYKQPTATKSYYFKVYSGVGFGFQHVRYYVYNVYEYKKYNTPSIAFIVGTKLSKRLTLEYIYRYSIKKNTYNKKNSQSYILKFRF